MEYWGNISSRFSSNCRANASELLENLEEGIIIIDSERWTNKSVCKFSQKKVLKG